MIEERTLAYRHRRRWRAVKDNGGSRLSYFPRALKRPRRDNFGWLPSANGFGLVSAANKSG